jgi:hypothetical protein
MFCLSCDVQMFFWSQKFELRRETHIIDVVLSNEKIQMRTDDFMEYYGNDRASKWIHWQVVS